jgi:hypothetical protein
MSGSSSLLPPCTTEVLSSRRPQIAAREACEHKLERTRGRYAPMWRPAVRAPLRHREPRLAKPTLQGGRRSGWLRFANPSTVPTAPTRTPCRGAGRERGRHTKRRHRACLRRWIPAPPRVACNRYLSGAAEPQKFTFPSSLAGSKDQPRLRISP